MFFIYLRQMLRKSFSFTDCSRLIHRAVIQVKRWCLVAQFPRERHQLLCCYSHWADTWKAADQTPQIPLVQGLFYVPSRVNTRGPLSSPLHLSDTTRSQWAFKTPAPCSVSNQTDDVMLQEVREGLWGKPSGLVWLADLTHFRLTLLRCPDWYTIRDLETGLCFSIFKMKLLQSFRRKSN